VDLPGKIFADLQKSYFHGWLRKWSHTIQENLHTTKIKIYSYGSSMSVGYITRGIKSSISVRNNLTDCVYDYKIR